jgi:circadian clock protein KaiC
VVHGGYGLFERESLEQRLQAEQQYTVFHPSEIELGETTRSICEQVERLEPIRVVFDSLSERRLLARDPLRHRRVRRQVLALKQFSAGRKCTVMLRDDRTSTETDLQLQSISHCVIVLERVGAEYGGAQRRLIVVKMRGLQFREGHNDFSIQRGGLQVFPRLVAAEQAAAGAARRPARSRAGQECNGLGFLDKNQPFLRWWAALKMKESQCPERAKVTRPA